MNFPGMKVKVKFLEPFKDGNIFPVPYKSNQEAEITMEQYEQAKRSGARMERIAHVLPEPVWPEGKPESVAASEPEEKPVDPPKRKKAGKRGKA